MSHHITIEQAYEQWADSIKPEIVTQYGEDDEPALSESWNDYTDSLCKDGALNDLQYHYCPAYDDTMPDDEPDWILEEMGVRFTMSRIDSRPDGFMSDMGPGSSHWKVTIERGSKSFEIFYSMGSAHTGLPSETGVFNSLLLDTSEDLDDFEDWADSIGYDSDSRKAYRIFEACQETNRKLSRMFTASELGDLREIFSDY